MADKYKFLLGAIITPSLAKDYIEGFYTMQDLTLYVNRGLGRTRVPFRFMSKPEITIFTLNIRNNSPIFLHILSCTRSSMFRLPYDKSESNKGGMFMYPYYQPIPVRSAPIGPVGDSRFFRFWRSLSSWNCWWIARRSISFRPSTILSTLSTTFPAASTLSLLRWTMSATLLLLG